MTLSVPVMLGSLLVMCSDRYTTHALRALSGLLVSYQQTKQAVHLSIFLLQVRAASLGQWIRVTPSLHLEWPARNYRHNVVCYVPWGKEQRKPEPPSSQKAMKHWKPKGEMSKVAGIKLENTFTSQNGGHLRMNEIHGSNNWK